jgi:hypothetical protein
MTSSKGQQQLTASGVALVAGMARGMSSAVGLVTGADDAPR